MANVWYWSRTVVMDVVLFCNSAANLKIKTYVFPFPLTPAEFIGDVRKNTLCAANMFAALYLFLFFASSLYNGTKRLVAPIYWCFIRGINQFSWSEGKRKYVFFMMAAEF